MPCGDFLFTFCVCHQIAFVVLTSTVTSWHSTSLPLSMHFHPAVTSGAENEASVEVLKTAVPPMATWGIHRGQVTTTHVYFCCSEFKGNGICLSPNEWYFISGQSLIILHGAFTAAPSLKLKTSALSFTDTPSSR